MDLKLQEVASLLKVSPTIVLKWMAEGRLPGYKIRNEYRFSRNEVEKVLFENDNNDSEEDLDSFYEQGSMKFDLFRAVFHGIVIDNVQGDSKEELITNATKSISNHLQLDHEALSSLLLDREAMMPTALGQGIALPHTRDFLMDSGTDIVSIVYPKKPIEYGALDKEPVHILFFLLASSDKRHLHLLSKIASFCQNEDNRNFLKTKPTHKQLLQSIRNWEKAL